MANAGGYRGIPRLLVRHAAPIRRLLRVGGNLSALARRARPRRSRRGKRCVPANRAKYQGLSVPTGALDGAQEAPRSDAARHHGHALAKRLRYIVAALRLSLYDLARCNERGGFTQRLAISGCRG